MKASSLLALSLAAFCAAAGIGCGKIQLPAFKPKKEAPPPQAAASTPAPTPAPTPTPAPSIDKAAQVIVFCYHRFEGGKLGAMSIDASLFEQQMQELKDAGISVISMQDFLAWRRGEKSIPSKSAIITIDDGYQSTYDVAWPILKKFNYPFTVFVYTKFVQSGGKSLAWAQLAEMRDAGVEIGSHSVTHSDLRAKKGRTDAEYDAFVRAELADSKREIEDRLGIRCATFAYPYGNHNDRVRQIAAGVGYEALFTVYGQKIGHGAPADQLGRYAIEQTKPEVFKTAIAFKGAGATMTGYQEPATTEGLLTKPLNGSTIADDLPEIKANLATMGDLDPASVEMRLSGFGLVPAKYDPASKTVTFKVRQKLPPRTYTVIVSGKAGGQRVEGRWSFTVDPAARPADAPRS